MRKLTISIFAATIGGAAVIATATLGFAQAYCACNGTGNVIDTPLLEKTNGAYGWAMSAPRKAVQPSQRAVRAVAYRWIAQRE